MAIVQTNDTISLNVMIRNELMKLVNFIATPISLCFVSHPPSHSSLSVFFLYPPTRFCVPFHSKLCFCAFFSFPACRSSYPLRDSPLIRHSLPLVLTLHQFVYRVLTYSLLFSCFIYSQRNIP